MYGSIRHLTNHPRGRLIRRTATSTPNIYNLKLLKNHKMVEHDPTLNAITKVSSTLSIIGSIFLVFRFLKSNNVYQSNLSNRIILYMSALDIVGSINFFIGEFVFASPVGCMIQGVFVEMAVSGPLWNCCFVMNVLLRVVFNMHRDKANKLEYIYHIVAWGIPIIGNTVAVYQDAFGVVGAWCWYRAQYIGLRFGTFYAFVFFSVFFNIIVSLMVMWYIRSLTGKFPKNKNLMRSGQRQLLYVVAFIFSFGPSSITRIVQLITGQQVYMLTVLQALTLPLQGFLNCIVYLILKQVKLRQIRESFIPIGRSQSASGGNWNFQSLDFTISRNSNLSEEV
eukprot:NODE_359_length_10180_cov_0.431703.p4 type:complete len:337 gc:universal NODE_359_length_10180_cov_0.431703:4143-3133(-)